MTGLKTEIRMIKKYCEAMAILDDADDDLNRGMSEAYRDIAHKLKNLLEKLEKS